MIEIDGAYGEGGGQILRTALALALLTQRPVRLVRIRAHRPRPGLRRQHLTAVRAAAAVGGADVEGAELGSGTLVFRPGRLRGGAFRFDVGTAGSTTLVLQTVLCPLLFAPEPATVVLRGGTHNPSAPPYEALAESFLPLLRRMGAVVDLELERHGFYPAGGGRIRAHVTPVGRLEPLYLWERGERVTVEAEAIVAGLPRHVGERELRVVQARLGCGPQACRLRLVEDADGPGNLLHVRVRSRIGTEVFTAFGRRGTPAEQVAEDACRRAQRYLAAGVPVGEHLADQLLLPMALSGAGGFFTLRPSAHTGTNLYTIGRFLDLDARVSAEGADRYRIELRVRR